MPPTATTRVFLLDDVDSIRALLRLAFESESGFEIVGEAADGLDGVDGIGRTQPDIVLLDLSLPGIDGLEAIPLIHTVAPRARIVVFSAYEACQMAAHALRRNASRYVEKGEPLENVVRAVREVARAA